MDVDDMVIHVFSHKYAFKQKEMQAISKNMTHRKEDMKEDLPDLLI